MRKLCFAVFFIAVFSAAAYCSDKKNDKMLLTVALGEEITIALKSSPAEGCSWIINNLSSLEKLVFVSESYEGNELAEQEEPQETFGRQIFTFKVADGADGIEELHFSYLKVWEKGVTPIEEKVVAVTIK